MEPTRSDGRARREALLDAALRCFTRSGVLTTRLEDIRREAGASPSSVYHLFGGLPDLTLALLVRTFERLLPALAQEVVRTRTARRAVMVLVRAHVEWVLEHRDEARFMYQAMSLELGGEAVQRLQAVKAALLAPIEAHLGRFIARGELPAWPPLLLDVVLLGPSHEACRRFLAGAPVDPAWMRRELPRLAWQSLAASPSG